MSYERNRRVDRGRPVPSASDTLLAAYVDNTDVSLVDPEEVPLPPYVHNPTASDVTSRHRVPKSRLANKIPETGGSCDSFSLSFAPHFYAR